MLLATSACDKTYKEMTVVKDCSGVYLRSEEGADYFVCNDDKLDSYNSGDAIKVETESVNECYGLLEEVTCTDPHPFKGKVEVVQIKD